MVRYNVRRCNNNNNNTIKLNYLIIIGCRVNYAKYGNSRLGAVVVSVLATVPKGRDFKPDQSDGFLKTIQIRSTPSSRMGSKAGGPCRKILRHVKDPLEVSQILLGKILTPSSIPPTADRPGDGPCGV
jgi:hypothetical protein